MYWNFMELHLKAYVTNPPIPSPARLPCTCSAFFGGNFSAFLVISADSLAAPLLSQFLFHAAGAPFNAPASFNLLLNVSECLRRAVKKTHCKVVERWLYGALTGTSQLFSSGITIFPPLRGPD
jgi:hypothetical protein